jgi:GR25 family glycosyltransferase involved in LPS biosynthesis
MKIDKVYIISIDFRPDYLDELFERAKRLPLPEGTDITIMKGFLGTRLFEEQGLPYKLYQNWDLSNQGNDYFFWIRPVYHGEAGGMISHIQCWEDAWRNGYENILILEDDFTLMKPINWDIFEEMQDYDWDMCLMAHNALDYLFKDVYRTSKIGKENFVRPSYFYNTHTYLMKRSGLEKLITDHLPILKENIIVSDEFLSAVTTGHPRPDIRSLFVPNINAIATKINYTGQSRFEMAGNSLTEPGQLLG